MKHLTVCLSVSSDSTGVSENVKPPTYSSLRSSEVKSDIYQDNHDEDDSFLSSCAHLPFIEYKGRVEYYTELHDIAIACDTLM